MKEYLEKRMHERFNFALPCLVSLYEDGAFTEVAEIETRDISAGGAFLKTNRGNLVGMSARLDIIMPDRLIKSDRFGGTHISADGAVVRTEAGGVAVAFYEMYRVAPMDEMLGLVKQRLAWMQKNADAGFSARSNVRVFPRMRQARVAAGIGMERM